MNRSVLRLKSQMPVIQIKDWVLRKVSLTTENPTEDTISPPWEGPYEVIGISRPDTYWLHGSDG